MKNKPGGFKLPQSQYIRQSQLIPFIVPFSSATLWRKVKTKEFPAPIKLSERITAWKVADVKEWLESKAGVTE
ncbi:AlpA family transcriptional regulator [Nitrosospira sp. Nsp2]|uniref:helix-turn-helix transcriptional regulator n=1 Tax=Nitrosospira sp. Nsp2 TaxID=136548 RepID=UPI000D31DAF5|nr:AlpA family phage regulatory protein [Nitrosospira sp. Nsp2]PTR14459.1 AlpA family transcriptional regulator [Nitrosospira sp. Nsp2]